ncbi:MAG: hypothetical protein LBU67_06930 [Oscillospiraceae bacterium]|jgi:uncharacterized FAD-dependent dehydrogenase|nr:hypothetical protein [Oscillospiraceae bacterium]
MIRIRNLSVNPDTPLDARSLAALAADKLGLAPADIAACRLSRQSVDARDKHAVRLILTLDVNVARGDAERIAQRCASPHIAWVAPAPPVAKPVYPPAPRLRPVVAGAGPAGLFAALRLAQAGWQPLLVERGWDSARRALDVAAFWRGERLNPQSNVQFGEGGAGAFSDGKLTTGIKDPRCREVLEALVACGAPEDILYKAKPHIGTDRLPGVVARLRQRIVSLGGEVRFGVQVTGLWVDSGALRGIMTTEGGAPEMACEALVLATGHSARDTYELLHTSGIALAQKPFSVGARVEHRQALIDRSQYGPFAGHPALGAAEYKLAVHLPGGRDVYTFCMCPGGSVVAAASEPGLVCTNGMSARARDGANANSAVLVGVDMRDFGGDHPLAGMYLQRAWEQAAFAAAGGGYKAPAQLVGDLLAGRPSVRLGDVAPTYLPGIALGDFRTVLPPWVLQALAEGLRRMDQQVRGFAAPDALLTGPETRSSSPVRILRGADGQASVRGIFPAGEGAGYAGGILSAAVDGLRAAEAILTI